MTDGVLAGLRVIDAATLAAGPLIATWLGEHGAEVIKVEQPDGGDPLRQWGAQRDGVGLMWKSVARNKKCVTINLRLEAGRDLLRSLTRQADVVIMNLRPSTLRKWGLEYGSLAAGNPGLVMAGAFEEFVRMVVPVLQQRGLFRREYAGPTLREHLGIARPESQQLH